MDSGNIFSPSTVPPPGLLRKLRPSSAARAEKPAMMPGRRSPTAVGSRTTVYFPGSRRLGLFHRKHFSIADRPTAAPSMSSILTAGCEAHPELLPAASRTVQDKNASATFPYAKLFCLFEIDAL